MIQLQIIAQQLLQDIYPNSTYSNMSVSTRTIYGVRYYGIQALVNKDEIKILATKI